MRSSLRNLFPVVLLCLVVTSSACATLQGLTKRAPAAGLDQVAKVVPTGPQVALIEKNLAAKLGAEALYSASAARGVTSPLCDVIVDRSAVGVLGVSRGRLDCFHFRRDETQAATVDSIREYQDRGNIHHSVVGWLPGPETSVHVTVKETGSLGPKLQIVTQGEHLAIAIVPLTDKAKGLDDDFVLTWADQLQLVDASQAQVDVLVKDPEKAKAIDLAAEKARIIAIGLAEIPRLRAEEAKADAAALEKVRFPPVVESPDAALAAKALKAHLEADTKVGIDPKSVKKLALTSKWVVEKNLLGFVMSRSADVTVGFARTDAYAIDPNKKCAFATFTVKSEYDPQSNTYEDPAATGAATGWTHIRCERLR